MGNVRDLRTINKPKKKQPPPEEPEPVEPEVEEEPEDDEAEEESDSGYSYSGDSGMSFTSIITAIIIIGLMIPLCFTAVTVLSNNAYSLQNIFPTAEPTPTITTGTYTGTLASITYDQNDYSGTIKATHINFADGNSFQLEGNANYAIGLQYRVTFQYYKSGNGDTVITHTDNVQLLNGGD